MERFSNLHECTFKSKIFECLRFKKSGLIGILMCKISIFFWISLLQLADHSATFFMHGNFVVPNSPSSFKHFLELYNSVLYKLFFEDLELF